MVVVVVLVLLKFENHWLQVQLAHFLVAFNFCPEAKMREETGIDNFSDV